MWRFIFRYRRENFYFITIFRACVFLSYFDGDKHVLFSVFCEIFCLNGLKFIKLQVSSQTNKWLALKGKTEQDICFLASEIKTIKLVFPRTRCYCYFCFVWSLFIIITDSLLIKTCRNKEWETGELPVQRKC